MLHECPVDHFRTAMFVRHAFHQMPDRDLNGTLAISASMHL
jgi:hypothetical protein